MVRADRAGARWLDGHPDGLDGPAARRDPGRDRPRRDDGGRQAAGQGLLGSEKRGCSDTTGLGLVADQAPDPPKQVPKGTSVAYTVSLGFCHIPTDGQIGEQVGNVDKILQDNGVAVTDVQAPTDVQSDDGLVKSISPPPGARPGPGRTATVTVWTYTGSGTTTGQTTTTP